MQTFWDVEEVWEMKEVMGWMWGLQADSNVAANDQPALHQSCAQMGSARWPPNLLRANCQLNYKTK